MKSMNDRGRKLDIKVLIKQIVYGAVIGVANIIPGVSGGTMAVILNVYDKLIQSISNLKKDFIGSMKFLIPIGIGAGIGILLFAKLIEFTLANFNVATNLVFIGLIVGSIPMIYNKVQEEKVQIVPVLTFVVCLGIMIYMGVANPDDSAAQIITSLTVGSFIKLFAASFIAAGAMIIPGISGSFVLLLLGIYTSVLTAISNLNIMVLIPVALGCAVGILVCAKIIDKLFQHFPQETYSGILGLMVGSIFVIFPSFTFNVELCVGVVLAIVAAVTAIGFSKK